MIIRIGTFHLETIIRALKQEDQTCGIRQDERSITIYAYDLKKKSIIEDILDSHNADIALVEWNAKQNRRANAEPSIRNIPGWATWTAQEAEDWIEVNVTDLASAKQVLKALAKMICYLRDHAGIV